MFSSRIFILTHISYILFFDCTWTWDSWLGSYMIGPHPAKTTCQRFSPVFCSSPISHYVGLFQLIYKHIIIFPILKKMLPHDYTFSFRCSSISPWKSYVCLLTSCFQLLFFLFLTHTNHLSALPTPLKLILSGSWMISLLINLKILSQISSYLTYQKYDVDNHSLWNTSFLWLPRHHVYLAFPLLFYTHFCLSHV